MSVVTDTVWGVKINVALGRIQPCHGTHFIYVMYHVFSLSILFVCLFFMVIVGWFYTIFFSSSLVIIIHIF